MHPDPTLPLVFTRDDALAAGMSRHQIAHRVRRQLAGAATHRLHPSAAVCRVDCARAAHHCRGRHVDGARTTSRARTVADTLRHLPNADGVALADSALRDARVSYGEIAAVLDRQARWPYADNARRALPLVDPRRESWLESYSFVTLHQLGLPMPEPQVSLFDARNRFVGRVDGWLEDEAVALESDGRAKYFLGEQPLSADVDLAAAELLGRARRRLIQEKERRDHIADLGAELARWAHTRW